MKDLKISELSVSDQIESFFEDFETSKKNIKLFTKFLSVNAQYDKVNITIPEPQKKFHSKIKVMNKKSNKGGIF